MSVKYHIERGEYSDRAVKCYLALLFLRTVLEGEDFANLVLHGMAQILAEHPEDQEEILGALERQTRFYEEVLRAFRRGSKARN